MRRKFSELHRKEIKEHLCTYGVRHKIKAGEQLIAEKSQFKRKIFVIAQTVTPKLIF